MAALLAWMDRQFPPVEREPMRGRLGGDDARCRRCDVGWRAPLGEPLVCWSCGGQGECGDVSALYLFDTTRVTRLG